MYIRASLVHIAIICAIVYFVMTGHTAWAVTFVVLFFLLKVEVE